MKAFLFLMRHLGMTQDEAQRTIAKGRLFIDGVSINDSAAYVHGAFQLVEFIPATRGLDPLFVTHDFAIFDKPSGVLVHPQNRHTDYSMVDEIRFQFGKHANITHRIDQETSGLLLASRHKRSEKSIKTMFEKRLMNKRYLAFVKGRIDHSFVIDAPLLRRPSESSIVRLLVRVDNDGKPSTTVIKPLEYFGDIDATLIEAEPKTGRQHQIRVHMFHVEHPILGDPIYGQCDDNVVRFLNKELNQEERLKHTGSSRLLLHASELSFELNGVDYSVRSKVDFRSIGLQHIHEV